MKMRLLLPLVLCVFALGCARGTPAAPPDAPAETAGEPAPAAPDLSGELALPTAPPEAPSAATEEPASPTLMQERPTVEITREAPLEPSAAIRPTETVPLEPAGWNTPTMVSPVEETVDRSGSVIDLTGVGRQAAYDELSFIAVEPGRYLGKTLRLSGAFASVYDDYLGCTFYGCTVMDVTECCRQGLDFVPAPGSEALTASLAQEQPITVEGVYCETVINGVTVYRLENAQVRAD